MCHGERQRSYELKCSCHVGHSCSCWATLTCVRRGLQVPQELVDLLFPFLPRLNAAVSGMTSPGPSRVAMPKVRMRVVVAAWACNCRHGRRPTRGPQRAMMLQVLSYLAVTVVQDALLLAEQYPNVRAHKLLLEEPTFK